MFTLISVIIVIVCILLVMIVLVQNSKGGGLSANFAGSSQVMGVRRTADFLEKATWTLAGSLLVLSILASMTIPKGEAKEQTRIEQQIDNASNFDPSALPDVPEGLPNENNNAE